jgi:beta-galactosidase
MSLMMSRRAVLHALALTPAAAAGSGTRPMPVSRGTPLNDDWRFGEYRAGAEAAGFDDAHLGAVTLPHCPARLPVTCWDSSTWERRWIYRRHLDRLPCPPDGRVFVDFDGVMTGATVVCNDQVVARHLGGYLPFSAEITGKVTGGRDVLSVIVDSRWLAVPPVVPGESEYSIDYMQPGGIYREVALRVTPHVYVSDLFAMPQDVLSASPRLDIQCSIDAGAAGGGTASLLVELLDHGRVLATETVTCQVRRGVGTVPVVLDRLGPVRLWSPDSPALYTVRATLTVPGTGVSTMSRRIGFREAVFQNDGFYLNGQRLTLFGLNRHQLFPYTGMAMPARVQRRDAEILRNEFNCNMVRCSHYPQSPAFLDACDELGLLVWQEAPGWDHVSDSPGWQQRVVDNVRGMVIRDRSRPSVIAWGTRLNETSAYPDLWASTRRVAKELDPSRPSTGAMDQYSTEGWAEDVFAFNDYDGHTPSGAVTLQPPLAGVPYLVSEAVGVLNLVPAHFCRTDSPAVLARQAAMHAQVHNAAAAPGYAGLVAWTAFDYSSLRGHPDRTKWAGVADYFRVAKPGAAVYQSQCDPRVRVVIEPAFFWEPGGARPRGEPLLIGSNCERLDLYVDGRPAGTARPATDDPRYGRLPYPPFLVRLPAAASRAELRIDGYIGGRLAASRVLAPGPAGDRLGLRADDAVIVADGSDMTRVVFRAVDRHGNQRRYFSGMVTLRLDGPGELVGENPFPLGQYGGVGAVWIRSLPRRGGLITVSASHPALGGATTTVRSGLSRRGRGRRARRSAQPIISSTAY